MQPSTAMFRNQQCPTISGCYERPVCCTVARKERNISIPCAVPIWKPCFLASSRSYYSLSIEPCSHCRHRWSINYCVSWSINRSSYRLTIPVNPDALNCLSFKGVGWLAGTEIRNSKSLVPGGISSIEPTRVRFCKTELSLAS